jgi:hypothetical protein
LRLFSIISRVAAFSACSRPRWAAGIQARPLDAGERDGLACELDVAASPEVQCRPGRARPNGCGPAAT